MSVLGNLDDIHALIASVESRLGRPLRILVIDDEENCFELLRRAMPHCETTWAGDALAGITLLTEEPDRFDAVVIDQKLPGMDGITCMREIRLRWPNIMTVMSSGFQFSEEAKQTLRELGPTMFLPKPVQRQAVVDLLIFIQERRAP